ncbi:hypothetical protein BDZ94DRAFT_1273518 [Collybia nuda]|uniref:Uncharacterized protein n=1 Tax=Collybia nuda TaxID=64659 RepID=A0A9P6CDT1_9AGAR|nr:hypothetical protein BDZ94DRAFT_1273518 [Collybia nuda]
MCVRGLRLCLSLRLEHHLRLELLVLLLLLSLSLLSGLSGLRLLQLGLVCVELELLVLQLLLLLGRVPLPRAIKPSRGILRTLELPLAFPRGVAIRTSPPRVLALALPLPFAVPLAVPISLALSFTFSAGVRFRPFPPYELPLASGTCTRARASIALTPLPPDILPPMRRMGMPKVRVAPVLHLELPEH